jgi:hypothetical protein
MEGFWLRKGKIYKVIGKQTIFKRPYILFSPRRDMCYFRIFVTTVDTLFAINLEGEFKLNDSIGIWYNDEFEELTVADWLEVGQFLKNTQLRYNLKTKEIIDITNKEEEELELI